MSKQLIRKTLENRGFKLISKEYMPCGIDLQHDIAKNTDVNSIKTVLDIGAHQGLMAKLYAEIFPTSTVYTFEPISDTFKMLKDGVANNSRIKPFNLGFSEESGTQEIFLQADSGLNSLNDKINKPDTEMGGKSETINITTIEAFCDEHKIDSIGFLKTDAEGMDLRILRGGERLFKEKKVKYVLVEIGFNEDNARNTPFEEVRKYLLPFGYKLRGIYDQSDWWNKQGMETANALFKLQE